MWNDISKDALDRIFTKQLTESLEETQQAMAAADSPAFNDNGIPICSMCDAVSLECAPLPSCSHPACPKCFAMASLDTSVINIVCRTCAEKMKEMSIEKSGINVQGVSLLSTNPVKNNRITMEASTEDEVKVMSRVEEKEKSVKDIEINTKETEYVETVSNSSKNAQDDSKKEQLPERDEKEKSTGNPSKMTQQGTEEVRGVPQSNHHALASILNIAGLLSMDVEESQTTTLFENVGKIQQALTLATQYSHCSTCLQAKKCNTPDLLCLNCALSFCAKCSARHKCVPSNSGHIMVPVEGSRRNPSVIKARQAGLLCPTHKGSELGMYCRNCEMLVCRECIVDHHLDCPGIVPTRQYASEEREAVKMSRMRYAQVMSFFSEQQSNTEETMAALTSKKKELQHKTRKYFSTLIKACMDVEAALLKELEMSVTDHTDLLIEQSSAWLKLQECTHQLLDITDVLHFLPAADFVPLSVATKASLSQALQEGETLAAEAPAHMTLALCLEQSSQRGVVKRIKDIGATALSVTTHSTLTLCKVTSTSFAAPSDKGDPQITSLALLTQTTLIAADFNNSCLKLLHKEGGGEGWFIADVLPLKWRPYAVVQLLEKRHLKNWSKEASPNMSSDKTSNSSDTVGSTDEKSANTETVEESENPEIYVKSGNTQKGEKRQYTQTDERSGDTQMEKSEDTQSSAKAPYRAFSRQSAVTLDDDEVTASEAAVAEVQVAVTSPASGCFLISVPVAGKSQMQVVQAISEETGCWGVAVMDENTVAISVVESGHCHISLVDRDKNIKWHLPLTSNTTSPSLLSPRHIVAVSPTTILVCDNGRKAIIQITMDGTIFYAYRGQGNNQLIRPEGMYMDSQGYVYITDSDDHSVTLLGKGGILYSKTGNQHNDLNYPYAVCVDRNGCLYVANEGGKVLTVYDIISKG